MSSTRTSYACVFAPDPQHEAEGKYVRVMIYEGDGQGVRAKNITFAENVHPVAFAFFSQFDDHYMHL
jgi:hypothetical protein